MDNQLMVGVDGIPGNEFSIPSAAEVLPINEMIDSDEAVEIALENGVGVSENLMRMKIEHSDKDRYIPPSWGLNYTDPRDSSQERRIIMDVTTGEVYRNNFAE